MTGALTLYRSSIGKKAIMAVSGIVLVGFLVLHMYGNTKMYQGPEAFNAYAAGLREIGYPVFGHEHLLWIVRVVLLAAVILHIWSATQLTLMSRASTMTSRVSNASRYGRKSNAHSSYASRTMRWGGIIIFLFIIYHLLHFTFGVVGYGAGQFMHPENGEYQVYSNVVRGFSVWPVSLFYIVAMVALAMHLYHGVWSAFQTLGLNNRHFTRFWRGLAILVTAVIVIPNISFPIAVLLGIVS
ncbi:MAG: succinate dehydrogenase cytochrome b subunit [Chloroflexales bacterium]|nr:succinate dehydrogenase cytochrome b subunit [Chloroflexales bacterium]